MSFNAKKTICIKLGKQHVDTEVVTFQGHNLKWADSVRHLGTILNNALTDADDIRPVSRGGSGGSNEPPHSPKEFRPHKKKKRDTKKDEEVWSKSVD